MGARLSSSRSRLAKHGRSLLRTPYRGINNLAHYHSISQENGGQLHLVVSSVFQSVFIVLRKGSLKTWEEIEETLEIFWKTSEIFWETWEIFWKTWEIFWKTSEIFWETWEIFFRPLFILHLTPCSSSFDPPRGRAKSTTALLTFQHSHARAYARTSAILYFLLSQPSHFSSQSPITVIDTLLFAHFLCRFSESPRRNAPENTLKDVRKSVITHYATIRYKDFCEGCESKKHKTPITRARGRGKTAALKICSHRSL